MNTSQLGSSGESSITHHEQWRSEIGFLGEILGDTIREQAGQKAFELVEQIRFLSWQRRNGDKDAAGQLQQLVAGLDETEIRIVIRAFTIFLDLLNLVEDRARTEVLRQRSDAALPATRSESIGQAFAELEKKNVSAATLNELLDTLCIELVFTAHPTEAKRRSVRGKLSRIRNLAARYHDETFSFRREKLYQSICRELALLWQTNFIRPWRPSVMQEVERGLSIKSVLWDVIPEIANEIRKESRRVLGDQATKSGPAIVFGSWIGGDRDGHPGVTAEVTADTLRWLRKEAINNHLNTCDKLFHTFTVSTRQADFGDQIESAVDRAVAEFPELNEYIAPIPPGELVRRQLAVIRWKLANTANSISSDEPQAGAYDNASQLLSDLHVLLDAMENTAASARITQPLLDWQSQIATFGFHLAKLDVRQNSSVYRTVIDELLKHTGVESDASKLDEAARSELLCRAAPKVASREGLSEDAIEVLELFSVLHHHASTQGYDAMGAQIVSMTSCASDILSVGWLWDLTRPSDTDDCSVPALVPLLETVDDLRNGTQILGQLFAIEGYRSHLRQQGDRQMIMLGYSDSTKDGGYLSACWALHECQRSLSKIARENGVSLTFFHGRGGSLGRGGGPAARSILSLPQSTFDGTIRITEQGEVLAQRYEDPEIAHRHFEQMVWASLLASGSPGAEPSAQWVGTMELLATNSRKRYRELIDSPGFVEFFRRVTPISEIEQLPIGSRPSRRKPDGGLSDLRAIPWVFSWTQCRCLLPAWFGMGTAIGELAATNDHRDVLVQMYQQWPFFRALVDNAELALAKADEGIMNEYFLLAEGDPSLCKIAETIQAEHSETCKAILQITRNEELLANIGWLKESIRVRNRFIDPLNLLQIEMMRRWSDSDTSMDQEHRHLMRLAINGVASGMRTSG